MRLTRSGANLHVHHLEHDNGNHHNHVHVIDKLGNHGHLSAAHSIHDLSHGDLHSGVLFEIDISPDGLLKNPNHSVLAIALLAFFFTIMPFFSTRQLARHYRESKLVIHRFYVLSPPLRAPPQH